MAYDVSTRSATDDKVPGARTPLAITPDHQGVFGTTVDGTDVLLLAPQQLDKECARQRDSARTAVSGGHPCAFQIAVIHHFQLTAANR